jgi:mannobiose 2-epimerase
MYPGQGFAEYAAHGVKYLQEVMWDSLSGGFQSLVNRDGQVIDQQWGGNKTAYGNSFGIYGLSAYVMATGDQDALELAKNAFRWLDAHAYDPEFGGYFQFISSEGVAYQDGFGNTPPKDQNSSIHLLEAFTELYQVWPNDTVRSRLNEMLITIRDVIAGDKAYMNLFSNRNWSPVVFHDSLPEVREANYSIDHVSFGHDIEVAYLMMEASEILGMEHDEKTFTRSKAMVNHVLDYGWDQQVGGIYDRGYYLPDTPGVTIILDSKVWWSQVEALNTLLIMSELYPDDPRNYHDKFRLQWDYIKTYLLDHEYGGILVEGTDKSHESTTRAKAGPWKANYHTARSLMNCINHLRSSNE